QGTLLVRGDNNINGPLATSATSLIRVQADDVFSTFARLTVAQGFTNQGTIEITQAGGTPTGYDSRLDGTSGTLLNAPGGSIRPVVGVQGGNRLLDASLDNQGTLTVEQSLSMNQGSAAIANSGVITLTTGDLLIGSSATTHTSGAINLADRTL